MWLLVHSLQLFGYSFEIVVVFKGGSVFLRRAWDRCATDPRWAVCRDTDVLRDKIDRCFRPATENTILII
jgi:hypothetical protein